MQKLKDIFFKNTTIRQTLIKNTFWIGVSTTLTKTFRAFIMIYAARLLGTESYGVFTYAMGIAAIFAVFSDMGLSTILVRELAKNTEKVRQYFSTALIVKLGFLAIMTLMMLCVAPLFSRFEQSTTLIPIIALSIVFDSLRNFLYAIPRAENRMQQEAAITILNEIFCIGLIITTFLTHPSPASLAYSFMIGNAIGLVVAFISVRKYLATIHTYLVRKLILPIIKLTAPFAVLSVFGIFMTNIDAVVLGIFGNEHLLGLYGAAQRPMGILYILPGFLSLSMLPVISKYIRDGRTDSIASLVGTASAASVTLAVPLIVGGSIVAAPLINVIFGSDYIGAVSTFQILLLTTVFVFPGTIYADVLLAENKQRIFILTGVLGAALNLGLDFLLIPQYGLIGSAIATVIAQAAVNIAFYVEMRKSYRVPIARGFYKTGIASIGMGLFVYTLKLYAVPLLLLIPLAIGVYTSLLFILKDRTILELRRSVRNI